MPKREELEKRELRSVTQTVVTPLVNDLAVVMELIHNHSNHIHTDVTTLRYLAISYGMKEKVDSGNYTYVAGRLSKKIRDKIDGIWRKYHRIASEKDLGSRVTESVVTE